MCVLQHLHFLKLLCIPIKQPFTEYFQNYIKILKCQNINRWSGISDGQFKAWPNGYKS